MPSGQHPNFQAQSASDYQNANHPHQLLAQDTPPLDVLGAPNLEGFEFPYVFGENTVTPGELKLDGTSDPFNLANSTEHRDSVSSIPPMHRNGYGSISGPTARQPSFSGGSDEASPTSNRMIGNLHQGDTPMVDDLKVNTGGSGDGSEEKGKDKPELAPAWTELKTKAGHDKKSDPKDGYMAMLDKRIKRMETRIMNTMPKEEQKEQNGTLTLARANVKPPIPGTLPSKTSAGKKRPAEEAFGPDLNDWSKSAVKPSKEIGKTVLKSKVLLAQEDAESKLLKDGKEKLPSRELQEHLAEVFFEKVYGQTYHLLHKPSFMMKLKSEALPPVLVLAVCACAARFSDHVELTAAPPFLKGEEWASEARDIVLKRYDFPNITILTCLLILGFHEFGTCHGGRSWALAGQAIRMAYALQLHKDLDYDPQKPKVDEKGNAVKLSFIDREIRRRTMWACFLMDRFESSGTGRPTFVKEETLEIQLPVKENMFLLDIPGPTESLHGEVANLNTPSGTSLASPKQNLGVAAYVIRSIALYSNIVTHFNQGGFDKDPYPIWSPESEYSSLIKKLKDFQEAMPKEMVYNAENLSSHRSEGLANQFIFLYIVIEQSNLVLNHYPAIIERSGPRSDTPKEFVTRTESKSIEAAGHIAGLIDDGKSMSLTAPFVGYCAFSASMLLVLDKVIAGSSDDSSSSIPQYGDWFDKFPHGVSQSDFEDPAAAVKKEKGDDAVLEQKSDLKTVANYVKDLPTPSPKQPNSKPTKQKVKRTQSTSQPSRPPQLDTMQTMPSDMQASHQGMQVSTPSSSHPQMTSQQAPQNSYNQNIMSPAALYPPPQYVNHHDLLMRSQRSQQPHNINQRQLNEVLGFDYATMDHSAMNGNGLHGGVMNGNSMNGSMNNSGTPGTNHNGDGSMLNWGDIGLGGMGNGYDMMGLENGMSNAWYPPFNLSPPPVNVDGMNDDAFGGNSVGETSK
ncbi:zinc finger transcription factor 1 [Botrytis cinerea]